MLNNRVVEVVATGKLLVTHADTIFEQRLLRLKIANNTFRRIILLLSFVMVQSPTCRPSPMVIRNQFAFQPEQVERVSRSSKNPENTSLF